MRVILINEFSDQNCPVTKLVYDLGNELAHDPQTTVVQLNLRTRYRPGGTRWQRVVSLFAFHLILPFLLIYQRLLALLSLNRLCVIATTLPPLIHWNALVVASVLRCKCVVWYQDAHPEIEARIFRTKGLAIISWCLEQADRLFFQLADHTVVLDEAMADLLHLTRGVSRHKLSISMPWTSFVTPAKAIRRPAKAQSPIRLIYAGNYGFAHDLMPFIRQLTQLTVEEKTRVSVTGIGMNETSRAHFAATFLQAGIKTATLPRTESFQDLIAMFGSYDFGIVSLKADHAGIASPSKAFTYISQGLPILFIGPKRSLPDQLVHEGYGVTGEDLIKAIKKNALDELKISETVVPEPKPLSIAQLRRAIYDQ